MDTDSQTRADKWTNGPDIPTLVGTQDIAMTGLSDYKYLWIGNRWMKSQSPRLPTIHFKLKPDLFRKNRELGYSSFL